MSVTQEEEEEQQQLQQQDHMAMFLYALKAPETKRQWPGRLKIFLDFLKLDGTTMEEKAKEFVIKERQSPQWAQDILMKFIAFQISLLAQSLLTINK